jgi:hypothetical protein
LLVTLDFFQVTEPHNLLRPCACRTVAAFSPFLPSPPQHKARAVLLDGLQWGVPTAHSVWLCFMFGPLGLMSHFITRKVRHRQHNSIRGGRLALWGRLCTGVENCPKSEARSSTPLFSTQLDSPRTLYRAARRWRRCWRRGSSWRWGRCDHQSSWRKPPPQESDYLRTEA